MKNYKLLSFVLTNLLASCMFAGESISIESLQFDSTKKVDINQSKKVDLVISKNEKTELPLQKTIIKMEDINKAQKKELPIGMLKENNVTTITKMEDINKTQKKELPIGMLKENNVTTITKMEDINKTQKKELPIGMLKENNVTTITKKIPDITKKIPEVIQIKETMVSTPIQTIVPITQMSNQSNINVVKSIIPKMWFEEKLEDFKVNNLNFNEIFKDLIPSNVKIDIDEESYNLIMLNNVSNVTGESLTYQNKTIAEILDSIADRANVFITYNKDTVKLERRKMKLFKMDAQALIDVQTNVSLGSGSSNGSSSSTGSSGTIGTTNSNSGSSSASASSINSKISVKSEDFSKYLDDLLNKLDNSTIVTKSGITDKIVWSYEKETGNLMIIGTKEQISKVETILNKIQKDKMEQVYVQIKVLKFSHTKGTSYGINWSKIFDKMGKITGPLDLTLGAFKSSVNGITGDLTQSLVGSDTATMVAKFNMGKNGTALIQALQQEGDIKLISEPNMVIKNGQTMTLNSGKVISYVASTTITPATVSGGAPTITYNPGTIQDGFNLVIVPKINKEKNEIDMFLSPIINKTLEITTLGSSSTGLVQLPTIDTRATSLFSNLKNGETMILAGLRENDTSGQDNSIPILGDIPIVKNLFGYHENSKKNDEFIILIRADIIQ